MWAQGPGSTLCRRREARGVTLHSPACLSDDVAACRTTERMGVQNTAIHVTNVWPSVEMNRSTISLDSELISLPSTVSERHHSQSTFNYWGKLHAG